MSKIKVLHIVTVMDMGGIETTLMNYMRGIDRTKIQFDFLVHRDKPGFFDAEIKELGGNIFIAPQFSLKSIFSYSNFFKNLLRINDYDIIHSHLDSLSFVPLYAAKQSGVKIRIAHSHVNGFDKDIKYPIRHFLKKLIPLVATDYFACSQSAGEFMFPKKNIQILLNPIPLQKFEFNKETREIIRNDLNVENDIVIGHIGRFNAAKNHKFIIALAKEMPKLNYTFILVGGGELQTQIEEQSRALGIENLRFIGVSNESYKYYSAFDFFILPSLYEGLGLVAIEAQVNGLPSLISNKVSPEVVFSDNVLLLPLDVLTWKNNIQEMSDKRNRILSPELIKYDVKLNVVYLLELYTNLMGRG